MKKSKTWIVFALFAAFIAVTIFAQYRSDKNMRVWSSPEKQLEMAQDNLNYYNEELELNKDTDVNPEYITYLQEAIENSKAQIENYEDIIKNGLDEKAWKLQLDQMIEDSKQIIESYKKYDDEWSKRYLMEEQDNLEMYNYLKDNNIEPLYGWEYEAYNYMTSLMQFLGMALLLCGIAVFMSDIVSGECTPATLKFLLVQPVTRGKVLLSKFISVTITVVAMILGGELIGFAFVNLTQRTGLHNSHCIPDVTFIFLIVSSELLGLVDELPVNRVFLLKMNGNRDRFVHLVAYHKTGTLFSKISFHFSTTYLIHVCVTPSSI